jgi:hypothetical protein
MLTAIMELRQTFGGTVFAESTPNTATEDVVAELLWMPSRLLTPDKGFSHTGVVCGMVP